MGRHAILVIKKEEKYLQYYDTDWKSYLFLNCKIKHEKEIDKIKETLQKNFYLDSKDIVYIGMKRHKKFSVKHNKYKEYEHYFYKVTVEESLLEEYYQLKNIEYRWFSYKELLENRKIQEVNSDIVTFIKEFNL